MGNRTAVLEMPTNKALGGTDTRDGTSSNARPPPWSCSAAHTTGQARPDGTLSPGSPAAPYRHTSAQLEGGRDAGTKRSSARHDDGELRTGASAVLWQPAACLR